MTAVFRTTHAPSSILDRSVGEFAEALSKLWAVDANTSVSVALDGPRSQARAALWAAFQEARAPNWDGEGAAPAQPLSYKYAEAFLDVLSPASPLPDICVDSDGEFCLEWDYGPRSVFSVSIGPDGTLTYAGLFGVNKVHGVETFTESIPSNIETYIIRAWEAN